MCRRVWILGLVGGLAVLAAVGPFLLSRSPVNRANYQRIGPGMPLAQVREILDGPGTPSSDPVSWIDWAGDGPGIAVPAIDVVEMNARPVSSRVWAARGVSIRIGFDALDTAAWGQILEEPDEPVWARLLRWLRL